MAQPLTVVIVEKVGILKLLSIKDFKLDELYRKCGFKKSEDFVKQVEWNAKYDGKKYFVEVFAKTNGRPNSENKYDFPPPIDNKLFFGSCAILTYLKNEHGNKSYVDLNIPLWNKIYEKLFGGFEDLTVTSKNDEDEEDELDNIPKEKKTKNGYLKDGFVIDNSDVDEDENFSSTEESELNDVSDDEDTDDVDDIIIEELGSELSEESYDYESDIDKNK
jgi:hypothetical protein